LRLIEVLEEADASPILIERGDIVYRLTIERGAINEESDASHGEPLTAQSREEQMAIVEQIVKRREAFFEGRVLPDDSTEILGRERDERSRHVAEL
jgi:hypothetical protein